VIGRQSNGITKRNQPKQTCVKQPEAVVSAFAQKSNGWERNLSVFSTMYGCSRCVSFLQIFALFHYCLNTVCYIVFRFQSMLNRYVSKHNLIVVNWKLH